MTAPDKVIGVCRYPRYTDLIRRELSFSVYTSVDTYVHYIDICLDPSHLELFLHESMLSIHYTRWLDIEGGCFKNPGSAS